MKCIFQFLRNFSEQPLLGRTGLSERRLVLQQNAVDQGLVVLLVEHDSRVGVLLLVVLQQRGAAERRHVLIGFLGTVVRVD